MNHKELHPLLQISLLLCFLVLLMMTFVSFVILFFPENDFMEFRTRYKLGLQIAVFAGFFGSIYIIYSNLKYRVTKNTALLHSTKPLVQWNYKKLYWEKFKRKEYQKKAKKYFLKISIIWTAIGGFVYLLYRIAPIEVSTLLVLFILIFTIPLVPFTIGQFIREIKNQLFQENYEVKIYINGLTINRVYKPFNHYLDNDTNLKLMNVEKINLYNTDCLKFIVKKQFYSPPSGDGGDFGSVIRREINILVPIPENQEMDLTKLKNQLEIET